MVTIHEARPGVGRRVPEILQLINVRGDGQSLSIGYFSPGWPLDAFPNGVVSYVADMDRRLREVGHHVTVVASHVAEGPHDTTLYTLQQAWASRSPWRRVMDGVGYRIAPKWTTDRIGCRLRVGTIRRAVAQRDIQLFEMEEAFGWPWWVRRATSIPICVRLHGPWFLNSPALGLREDEAFFRRVVSEGRAIAAADAVTAPSHDVLERTRAYYQLPLRNAVVIPPPTPPVSFANRWRLEDCDPNLVLFIGRFDRHKGGDLMIEAFGLVRRELPQARLCFVGPDNGFNDSAGRKWGLEEFVRDRLPGALEAGTVTLMGHQPFSELDRLRRQAMVNVVCSRYETICRVLMETMAVGCPIVAARAGGIPEAFRVDVDGLSHRPEDSDDLASKIITLLNNPARAAQFGREAATTCEKRFHPDVIAERMIDFYRQSISKGRGH
jgi:glycosyltransferase involved in cell wall biosynthesis